MIYNNNNVNVNVNVKLLSLPLLGHFSPKDISISGERI